MINLQINEEGQKMILMLENDLFYFLIFYWRLYYIFQMNNPNQNNRGDTLDNASQEYSRVKSGYSNHNEREVQIRSDLMLKNLYRQQLDDIMTQKNEQKRLQKERQMQEKQQYNDRISYGKEAERLKDLSYKNYYQLLLNNQANLTKNHQGYNYDGDNLKDKLIQQTTYEGKVQSANWHESEQKRLQNMKRQYRDGLAGQLNQKQFRNAQEYEVNSKQKQQYNKISFTPAEVAKYQRDRKLMEMSKYKQDLDNTSPVVSGKYRVMAGQQIVSNGSYMGNTGKGSTGRNNNDFNIHKEATHNPMVNPMPYNIQNPYILREFQRRDQYLKSNNGPQNNAQNNNIFN